MKLFLTTIFALIGAILLPSMTFADTRIVNGCEVATVPGTNYSNLVDPTCVMATPTNGLGVLATAVWGEVTASLDD